MNSMVPDPDDTAARALVELGEDECYELLARESIGRLACASDDGAPDVVPVNFVLRGGAVWFRAHDGCVLEHVVERPVSLQVDRIDWSHHVGWSVLVHGVAELVDTAAEVAETIDTWAPGDHPRLVCIVPTGITGRRIAIPETPDQSGGGYL